MRTMQVRILSCQPGEAMKVKDLKEILGKIDEDRDVRINCCPQCHGFSPVATVSTSKESGFAVIDICTC